MRVVHLGADAPQSPRPKRAEPTVATLGHVIARKRHVDVLRALGVLVPRVPGGVRWLVIGDGPERAGLERLAAQLGLDGSGEWGGPAPPRGAPPPVPTFPRMAA